MAERSTRVLIADDHRLFRAGLKRLIEAEPGCEVVGEASDGAEAVRLTLDASPDVLLLDLSMPGSGGLGALRELASRGTKTRIVLVAAAITPEEFLEAMRLGAAGALLKTSAADLLFKCLRAVMAGEYWVGRGAVSSIVEAMRGTSARLADPSRGPLGLSPRELEVVALVGAGASNKEIADKLAISENTVKHRLTRIFEKTGVPSRVQLALFASRHDIGPAR
jgi:two-component system nitrate/nitrite response regulator NarL